MMKKRRMFRSLIAVVLISLFAVQETNAQEMVESKLFVSLPNYCPTPDGMDIDSDGSLVLACPNFADQTKRGCIVRISKNRDVEKWFDVPVDHITKLSCPMGIQFGEDGSLYICDNQAWSGTEQGENRGRLLKVIFNKDASVKECITIASGMEHPNGVRVRDGKVYITQSILSRIKDKSGLLVSGVYCFDEDDRDIIITNTLKDKNLITTVITKNKEVQYGLDGLVFDKKGNLYVGNFGDGAVHKICFDSKGRVIANDVWAKDSSQLVTVDGICMDSKGNIWVADFSANAVAKITTEGVIRRIAQSSDCDGSKGGLDQPGEPIIWNGSVIVSCFDLVTGPDKINTKHDKPYTLAKLKIE